MTDRVIHKSELFVRSLPKDATTEEVTNYFSELAPVKHAVVVKNPDTDECKGFGFVSFASADDAELALKESRKNKFRNRTVLQVDFAKARTRGNNADNGAAEESKSKPVEKRRPRLIIRNMPWSVRDKATLEKAFSKYGKVVDAFIPRKDNGRMSGFAFITMNKKRHAMKAIEGSSDLKIGGRQVAVDWAVEKEKWINGESQDGDDSESESESESEDEVEDDEEEKEEQDEDDDDDEEEEEEEEDDDDDDEEKEQKPKVKGASNNVTIFVRNIPYDATAESLKEHFEQFGRVRYALPVMDKVANQPKGTAFVAFSDEEVREECVKNAPSAGASSLLIADDVDPRYVLEGRILSISNAVERDTANKLADLSARKRDALLGKSPNIKDKRNTFLLNEGRITKDSKLAQVISNAEMEIREKAFKERRDKLNKHPNLHVSLTRVVVKNLPRAMTESSLKQLGRKGVVEFAKEVESNARQPLSKEETQRSTNAVLNTDQKKSKHGVVRQAKIVRETKDGGDHGRSRGFGFIEFRDHRSALMGLRWLNAHKLTDEEVKMGLSEEEAKQVEPTKGKRLVVEFSIENTTITKKRQEMQQKSLASNKRKREEEEQEQKRKEEEAQKRAKTEEETSKRKVQQIIANKRKSKKGRK